MKRFIYALIITCLGVILIGLNTKELNPPLPEQPTVEAVEAPQPTIEPVALPTPEPAQPIAVEPVQAPKPATVNGECDREIAKYDWDFQVAHNVMMAESGGGKYWIVNDNPSTRDYSVGCFQINLYGDNARTRPSEAELKDPAINVAFAYRLYSGNGKSFIGQWGVCRDIYCY
jgi:hypothetical protein